MLQHQVEPFVGLTCLVDLSLQQVIDLFQVLLCLGHLLCIILQLNLVLLQLLGHGPRLLQPGLGTQIHLQVQDGPANGLSKFEQKLDGQFGNPLLQKGKFQNSLQHFVGDKRNQEDAFGLLVAQDSRADGDVVFRNLGTVDIVHLIGTLPDQSFTNVKLLLLEFLSVEGICGRIDQHF